MHDVRDVARARILLRRRSNDLRDYMYVYRCRWRGGIDGARQNRSFVLGDRGQFPVRKPNERQMGLLQWWSQRRGGNQKAETTRRGNSGDAENAEVAGEKDPVESTTNTSKFTLARLPSKLVVDVDFAKDEQGKMPVCELVHMVVDSVTIPDLDLTCLPKGRKKAVERQALKSFCTVSIGKQTYVTPDNKLTTFEHDEGDGATNSGRGAIVRHGCGATFVVSQQGATKLRAGVYCRGRLDGALKNRFIGYGLLDLEALIRHAEQDDRAVSVGNTPGKLPSYLYETRVDIMSPSGDVVVGELKMNGRAANVVKLEEQLWVKLLTIGDWSDAEGLDFEEFLCVMEAFGSEVGDRELFQVFEGARELSADEDSTRVDVVSLARALSNESAPGADFCRYVPFCPVDGAVFSTDPAEGANNILYCWLALSESIGDSREMKAGYLTESEASRAWALKLTEWNGFDYRRKKRGGVRVDCSPNSLNP